ncbi:MAG: GNAT family N-acetyltransferase [Rhizobacter sp.]
MDMLIKLYALPAAASRPLAPGVEVRKPIGPENSLLVDWVGEQFGKGWASEMQAALVNRPISVFIATQGQAPVGFACYDATARGLFGPMGVGAKLRGQGVGEALLLACLNDMRAVGYAYAVAGSVGPTAFFQRAAGAIEIADSHPGLYRGMLRG